MYVFICVHAHICCVYLYMYVLHCQRYIHMCEGVHKWGCTCTCVFMCVHVYMCVGTFVHVCACSWRPEDNLGIFSSSTIELVFVFSILVLWAFHAMFWSCSFPPSVLPRYTLPSLYTQLCFLTLALLLLPETHQVGEAGWPGSSRDSPDPPPLWD